MSIIVIIKGMSMFFSKKKEFEESEKLVDKLKNENIILLNK